VLHFLLVHLKQEDKRKLEALIIQEARDNKFELNSVNFLTNENPLIIQIFLKKIDGFDITIEDCTSFNDPVNKIIDNSKLLNCAYVLEISSQGVSDELTSNRDFKTFKGFPVKVELNHTNSEIKNLKGLLFERSKDYLAINIKGKIKNIPLVEVLKVSLATIKD